MPPVKKLTLGQRWSLHVETWGECEKCQYHKDRKQVCLGRGDLPCDLLIIGDAPTGIDDVFGEPFVDRTGIWLDEQLAMYLPASVRRFYTNLVGCLPSENGKKSKTGLDDDAVKVCRPRVNDIVAMTNPKVILCLGKACDREVDPQLMGSVKVPPHVKIIRAASPAMVMFAGAAQKGFLENIFAVALMEVASALEEGDARVENHP